MRNWNDIYELSGKIYHYLFHRLEDEPPSSASAEEDWPEDLVKKLAVASNIREGLQQQRRYDSRQAWQKLMRHRQSRRIRRWSVAAGIMLLLAIGQYWWTGNVSGPEPSLPLAEKINPGEKKAILTLADGSVWNIQDSAMNIRLKAGNIKIDSTGLIMPSGTGEGQTVEYAYNTLSIPRGGEYCLTLPDRTKVWLNSESEICFPVQFPSDSREITLKGEAYFEVAKNPSSPFRVKTDEGVITVYGTEFNVSNYNRGEFSAVLVTGSIGFQPITGKSVQLKPSQRLKYNVSADKLIIDIVDTRLYTSWKDHLFCFEEESLEEIMKTLARWYDVEVEFVSVDLKQVRLSGTLDKYDDIIPFLKLFEVGTKVRFEIDKRKIKIYKRNN